MDSAEEAADYDAMDHSKVNRRFAEDFAAFAGERSRRILDVGTGTAQIPILICARLPGTTFLATDLSLEMLALARGNVERAGLSARIAFAFDDAKAMRFESGSFDAVTSNTILHHIPEPASALAQMWRVLASGGALFVRDLARPASLAEVANLVAKYGGAPTSSDPRSVASHARQRAGFEASLLAALRLDELRSLMAPLGIPASAARMTSDRHWTLAHVKP
jgi:ubiquinone/menaquinone biosynthesis C-methylase UbiE